MAKLFLQTVNTLTRRRVLSSQYDINIFFSFILFFVIVERDRRHQVTVIIKWWFEWTVLTLAQSTTIQASIQAV